jgi:hypothetical protein
MNLEIKPTIGLGDIKFGITRDELKQQLGEPNEIENITEEGENVEHWHYDDIELSALFSERDNWRLLSLAISNEDCTINGKKFIGISETELEAAIEMMGVEEELEYEDLSTDEFPDHILIYSDDLGMSFWMDSGVLSEIQWGPMLIDEDTVEWPQ